jgi:hypothetical protein
MDDTTVKHGSAVYTYVRAANDTKVSTSSCRAFVVRGGFVTALTSDSQARLLSIGPGAHIRQCFATNRMHESKLDGSTVVN